MANDDPSFKAQSRLDWRTKQAGETPSDAQLILGCLQRIADTLERDHRSEAAMWRDAYVEQRRRNDRLAERIRRLERKGAR